MPGERVTMDWNGEEVKRKNYQTGMCFDWLTRVKRSYQQRNDMNKFMELRKFKTVLFKSEYAWSEWLTYKMGGITRPEIYLQRRGSSFSRTGLEAGIVTQKVDYLFRSVGEKHFIFYFALNDSCLPIDIRMWARERD